MWAEDRKKGRTFPGTIPRSEGVEGHHTGGTGESYLWLLRSTYKGGGQRRLKRLGKDPQGGPCVSCQGAEVLSMPVR